MYGIICQKISLQQFLEDSYQWADFADALVLVYFIFVIHFLNGSVKVNGNLQKHIVNSWQVFVQSAPAEKL